jgi:hypothetical protein
VSATGIAKAGISPVGDVRIDAADGQPLLLSLARVASALNLWYCLSPGFMPVPFPVLNPRLEFAGA